MNRKLSTIQNDHFMLTAVKKNVYPGLFALSGWGRVGGEHTHGYVYSSATSNNTRDEEHV